MKKVSLLAASVAFALTGCGGSDGDSSSAAPGGVVITAIDGYLENAQVWVDTNDNLKLDSDDKQLDSNTNANGEITLPNEYKTKAVFIRAIAGQTIDKTRGLVTSDFDLAATAGATVVSPMTNMVVEQLEAAKVTGTELTQEQAEDKVVKSVTNSGLTAPQELIFGDYIAEDSQEAEALNVIGESLVDNAELPVEQQIELTDAVAQATKKVIDDGEDLEDFSPVIEVPEDGPIEVKPNTRPTHTEAADKLEDIEVVFGDTWQPIDASNFFEDIDGDALTYELVALDESLNGLSINEQTGLITGELKAAGEFDYQIFAKDSHGSLSYPVNLEVDVESPNSAPTVEPEEKSALQKNINGWQLVVGEQPQYTLTIDELFDDEDDDQLTYRAESTLSKNGGNDTGFQVIVNQETATISFDGPVPFAANAGAESLYVYAKDAVNAEEAMVKFALPKIEEGSTEPSPKHALEDKFLHFTELGNNDTDFSKAWCDSIYLDSESKMMYWNNRDSNNLASCDTDMSDFEEGVSYEIVGNKIVSIEGDMKMTLNVIEQGTDTDGERFIVSFTDEEGDEKSTELYTYYTNADYVEETISNDVNYSSDNAEWAEREAYIAMPPSEGSKEIVVTELNVSGIVQQFPWGDGQYTSASIHGGDATTCEILEDIYFDYGSFRVHGDNATANNYFDWNPTFKSDEEDDCYINLEPKDRSAELPKGLYTIEAEPERLDEGERILFSFKK